MHKIQLAVDTLIQTHMGMSMNHNLRDFFGGFGREKHGSVKSTFAKFGWRQNN